MRRAIVLVLLWCACAAGWGSAPAAAAGAGTATTGPPATAVLTHPAPAPATPAESRHARTQTTTSTAANPETPVPVAPSDLAPAGRRLTPNQVLAIAAGLPKMRAVQRSHRGAYAGAYLKGPLRWQVSYFTRDGKKEIGQVIIDDATGRVLEQWTGFQIAWTMARGYPGAFGRHVNALYVWLPLCFLFFLPFFDWRRPWALLHLDLAMLLFFSVSLAFFNHANIYASVPLAYPPLVYLLVRMLFLLRRRPGPHRPLRLLFRPAWLAIGVVFLLGFRIALNVTDANVIDVGYAGLIGAKRVVDGRPLYGSYPSNNEHGDTYGPANYESYIPFEQVFGFSGSWDDLPAAHAAAVFFDLLAVGLLFLLGRRTRGPTLGIALAYAWVSYPFTLFALESNSNDTLVGALILLALLAASMRSRVGPAARGAASALAGLTKFAPLALAPVMATHGLRLLAPRRRVLALGAFAVAFAATTVLVAIPALAHDSLHEIWQRTIEYQADRGSPFSVWGLYGGLGGPQTAVEAAAATLAVLLALVPRRDDLVGLAAACAAIVIATQLGIEHWFYLYIPWFFGLVMLALLGRLTDPVPPVTDAASAPARSSLPAVAAST